ncbi:MAG TPA: nucleotide sugar dehydrogenase [Xanthobacteraceae bacterium]|nr:nucleotide sugar dehydrogenase [Xanthobacteraceae bacterium]
MSRNRNIAVIGLGYVGLPVATSFGRAGFKVVGFDNNARRIEELRDNFDRTREVAGDEIAAAGVAFTSEVDDLRAADFYIVTVPTPIDSAHAPNLSMVLDASRTVGGALKRGDIVVYESTVYPGATEDACVPVLESASGLKGGSDFTVGYSPERLNPGDKAHRFETITKVVSGQDERTLGIIAATYGAVVKAGIYPASSIKVAEAAKVIENTQRDLNIALMNELSLIFARMGIDTRDVLMAAATKWNFLAFTPGLVGGHCIGVDPYYLTHAAERLGYHPQVVLAGRRVNDSMGQIVGRECIRRLVKLGRGKNGVIILGITFKENVPDVRNSKVVDIISEIQSYGIAVQVCDPEADAAAAAHEYHVDLVPFDKLQPADAVIVAVGHQAFVAGGWPMVAGLLRDGTGVVLDVKGLLDRAATPKDIDLWRM